MKREHLVSLSLGCCSHGNGIDLRYCFRLINLQIAANETAVNAQSKVEIADREAERIPLHQANQDIWW